MLQETTRTPHACRIRVTAEKTEKKKRVALYLIEIESKGQSFAYHPAAAACTGNWFSIYCILIFWSGRFRFLRSWRERKIEWAADTLGDLVAFANFACTSYRRKIIRTYMLCSFVQDWWRCTVLCCAVLAAVTQRKHACSRSHQVGWSRRSRSKNKSTCTNVHTSCSTSRLYVIKRTTKKTGNQSGGKETKKKTSEKSRGKKSKKNRKMIEQKTKHNWKRERSFTKRKKGYVVTRERKSKKNEKKRKKQKKTAKSFPSLSGLNTCCIGRGNQHGKERRKENQTTYGNNVQCGKCFGTWVAKMPANLPKQFSITQYGVFIGRTAGTIWTVIFVIPRP